MTRRVLEGHTVLELGQVYNVPYCALLLAHLGADVLKIEAPHWRTLSPPCWRPGCHPVFDAQRG